MRVTNNMMRNNSMLHIQKNKVAYNDYFNQFATEKKIQKPSDDPTIAVRALKYRTTMIEIEQYLKNCDDAENWMDATEEPMNKVNKILDTMIEYVTHAANDPNSAKDRATIAQQLREYSGFIYEQNGNMDYAGRYLFTGFRTDTPFLFKDAQSDTTYTITEELDITKIETCSFVYRQPVYADGKPASDYANEASRFEKAHRIALSYNNCDIIDADKNPVPVTVTYTDVAGTKHTITATTKSIPENTEYNEHYLPGDDEVYFVPETGEIIFGENVYNSVRAGSDLSVVYAKTNFEKNDIRPEHYFACHTVNIDTTVERDYGRIKEQQIEYQINFSQTLTVNTLGCNAFDTSIGRVVDQIYDVMNDLNVMEDQLSVVKKRIEDCPVGDTTTLENLQELQEQLETEIALQNTVLTNSYSHAITVFQKAKEKLNVAVAEHGARYNRLKMSQSQLEVLELDTDEAKSENENIDLEEIFVNYTEADLLYQASLQATAKILGTSLLDFI